MLIIIIMNLLYCQMIKLIELGNFVEIILESNSIIIQQEIAENPIHKIEAKTLYLIPKQQFEMSTSPIFKDLSKHNIRKQILKRNTKLNHKSFVKSMGFWQKIPFLLKYHKKKTVLFIVMGIITWNYSLHRWAYDYVRGMRPPHMVLLGLVVETTPIESTVLEQSTHKLRLQEHTINTLIQVYYEAEKYLYFGIGRNYMFHVYRELGLLQKGDEQDMFWQKSTYFKKRNQMASGVGMVEFLEMFEEALKKKKEKNPSLGEAQFCQQFLRICIDKAPEVMQWEKEFNVQRQKQFMKNLPGLSEVKREMISDIMKKQPRISLEQLDNKIIAKGLQGLNLSDRYFYYRTRQVQSQMREIHILKQLSHPNISLNLSQKLNLQQQLGDMKAETYKWKVQKESVQKQYNILYVRQLL